MKRTDCRSVSKKSWYMGIKECGIERDLVLPLIQKSKGKKKESTSVIHHQKEPESRRMLDSA